MDAVLIVVTLAVFATGIVTGIVLIVVATAIRREERDYRRTGAAPDVAARGVRRLAGFGVHSADHAAHDLRKDSALNNTWLAANSQIEDTYKRMGPPPSGDAAGDQDE